MPSNRDMDEDDDEQSTPSVFDALLMPLRLPGRVVADIETLAQAVVTLQQDAQERLGSIDDSAGKLVGSLKNLHGSVDEIKDTVDTLERERMPAFLEAIGTLQGSIDRIENRVQTLESLEHTIEDKMEQLREDLNARMHEVEHEVRGMHPPLEQIARDVTKLEGLLPEPSDGPLTRLKDTLSSS